MAGKRDQEYDALVEEASRKLNAKYIELQGRDRPAVREAVEKIRQASDEQLRKIMEILEK